VIWGLHVTGVSTDTLVCIDTLCQRFDCCWCVAAAAAALAQVPDIPRLLQRLQLMQAKPDAACFKQLSEGLAALFQLRQQVQGLAPGALLQQRLPWEVADAPAQVSGWKVGHCAFSIACCWAPRLLHQCGQPVPLWHHSAG
jgi:hypothetical protein